MVIEVKDFGRIALMFANGEEVVIDYSPNTMDIHFPANKNTTLWTEDMTGEGKAQQLQQISTTFVERGE